MALMVLPLAPMKRTSWIRMPPEGCVRWASKPPARMRISPAIASDHLRRMVASPYPQAVAPAFGLVFAGSLWLWLIPYPKGERAQAPLCGGTIEVLTEDSETSLSRLYCLRNSAPTGNRMASAGETLNQVLQSLIQNLQTLNQK